MHSRSESIHDEPNRSETATVAEIDFCPVCGSDLDPLFAIETTRTAECRAECPEHGEVEIDFSELG